MLGRVGKNNIRYFQHFTLRNNSNKKINTHYPVPFTTIYLNYDFDEK